MNLSDVRRHSSRGQSGLLTYLGEHQSSVSIFTSTTTLMRVLEHDISVFVNQVGDRYILPVREGAIDRASR